MEVVKDSLEVPVLEGVELAEEESVALGVLKRALLEALEEAELLDELDETETDEVVVLDGAEVVEGAELVDGTEVVDGAEEELELSDSDEVVCTEVLEVVTGGVVELADDAELVAVKVYVIQLHAELTAVMSPAQLPKSVGIADAAVVVPESHSKQNGPASALNRLSTKLL